MTDEADLPQIYLITPTDLDTFPDRLAACLDAEHVACVRLALATRDEDRIGRTADAIRAVTSERDVALVIERHVALVARHGLDGVHLLDGARSVRAVRKDLGEDAIIGTFCGQSRHDGMTAGELNADYVSFGPVGETALDDGSRATLDLFDWWSQMIEIPVVAEGALDLELIRAVSPHVDFFALGDEIWRNDDPVAALRLLMAAMS
jgi:thiamine-phosphate pyrophosphorylase